MSPKELTIAGSKKDICIDYSQLIGEIKRYMPDVDESKIKKALDFASIAHENQLRKDSSPYVLHPYETARILASMHVDEDTIVAAILHDVPEDTTFTIKDIESKFGKRVSFLVDGVTKLAKVHYKNDMALRQVESLKKMFLHTTQDPRIILIKLADRLHNMRTLQFIDKDQKRNRISRETLEIYVPIANLIGIEEMKAELEDLCFKFLLPDEYNSVNERMRRCREANQRTLEQTIEKIEEELKNHRIHATVVGRQMHLYTVYKKMLSNTRRLDEYDNLISIRVLAQYKDDCYKILGILHALFKPKPGKFKDYIASPKINGYQSLHSTVFGINGAITEFQIRTHQMHLEAEYGMASRYFFTSKKEKKQALDEDKRSNWADKIVQMQKLQNGDDDFLAALKGDVFNERIFVFSPMGQTIDLPVDATCIDFAYQIHTEVGNRALKADVNGQIVPMATALTNGDTVRIITSDLPKGPDRSWLPFAKTNTAKNRIKDYFRKTSRENKINIGRKLLQKEMDRAGLGLVKDISYRQIKSYLTLFPLYRSFNEVLAAIGEGSIRSLDVVSEIYPKKTNRISIWKRLGMLFMKNHGPPHTNAYIRIISKDAVGQLEKILQVVTSLRINAIKTEAYLSFFSGNFICRQTLSVKNFAAVSELFENLEQIDGVKKVERLFYSKIIFFHVCVVLAFLLWAGHPFLLDYWMKTNPQDGHSVPVTLLLYGGLATLFMLVYLLKQATRRSFPEFRETNIFWSLMYVLTIFASITVLAEIYFLNLDFNIIIVVALILINFGYLIGEHLLYRKNVKNALKC